MFMQRLSLPFKNHQIIAANWMLLTESNGCLGGMERDEMGYGKVYYRCSAGNQMLMDCV